MPVSLIDPPSPFSPTKQWQDFLEAMSRQPDSQEVMAARNQAQQELAQRAEARKPWWREETSPTSA